MCLQNILSPVFMFAFTFHCHSCSSCWPLAFLIVFRPLFSWFSSYKIRLLLSITRSSSFSIIHVSVNIKNKVEKDTTYPWCSAGALCAPELRYKISAKAKKTKPSCSHNSKTSITGDTKSD